MPVPGTALGQRSEIRYFPATAFFNDSRKPRPVAHYDAAVALLREFERPPGFDLPLVKQEIRIIRSCFHGI